MYRIRKTFTFEAAHQLENAQTQECVDCIHGHSYKVEYFIISQTLDHMKMVADFGAFRDFRAQIMETWDHGLLLHEDKAVIYQDIIDAGHLDQNKVHFFKENPTAETLARILYEILDDYLQRRVNTNAMRAREGQEERVVWVEKVRLHETATGWAEFEPDWT